MKHLGHTVEMNTNLDELSIGYWVFDNEEEAREFYEVLKRGCTAHSVTVNLEESFSNGSKIIESFVMGDEENAPTVLTSDKA